MCVFQIYPKFWFTWVEQPMTDEEATSKLTVEPLTCVYLAAWSLWSQFIGCVFRCILHLLCNFIRCQIVRNRFKPTETEHITKCKGLNTQYNIMIQYNDLYSTTVKCRGARGQAVSGRSQTNMSLYVFWMTSNYHSVLSTLHGNEFHTVGDMMDARLLLSEGWLAGSTSSQELDTRLTRSLFTATDELSRQVMCIVRCHWRVYRHSVHVTQPYTGTTAPTGTSAKLSPTQGWHLGKNWPGSERVKLSLSRTSCITEVAI